MSFILRGTCGFLMSSSAKVYDGIQPRENSGRHVGPSHGGSPVTKDLSPIGWLLLFAESVEPHDLAAACRLV
jgi:hypothetical protein